MSNTVKAKQKKTIIVCVVLSVLLLAGSLFVILDSIIHMDAPYKQFGSHDFAVAFAKAIGKDNVRQITAEDLAKVESFVYYYSVGNDSENDYETYAYPVVMLGYKQMADDIINSSENEPAADSYVVVNYPIGSVEDITVFENLRVLRTFDMSEVYNMMQGCYYTQIYSSYYGMGTAVSFDQVLKASGITDIKKLSQFANLTKLEQLSLEYTSIKSLEGIENFPNLKKLDIGFTSVENLDALSSATGLEDLTLLQMDIGEKPTSTSTTEEKKESTYGLKDISALASLTSLKALNIEGNAISDISALSGMTKLEHVVLNNNNIKSLDAISGLASIESIYASNNFITDINGISGCANLKNISIYSNELVDITELSKCTKLETIEAYSNKIEKADFSGLTELTTLDIYNNSITDISSLKDSTKLTTLNAYENKITTIGDLSALDELTEVSIYENLIVNLNGFNGCQKLEALDAHNNTLDGTLDLTGCEALVTLKVGFEAEEEETTDADSSKTESSETESSKVESSEVESSEVESSEVESSEVESSEVESSEIESSEIESSEAESSEESNEQEEDVAGPMPDDGKDKEETNKNESYSGLDYLVVKGLKKLTTIEAAGNQLVEFPDLTDCEKLTTINFADNNITNFDKASTATALTTLTLSNNGITDISKLESLETLTTLDLSNNDITDIYAIGKLVKLTSLNLSKNTALASIKALESFPASTTLALNIIDTEIAKDKTAITELQAKYATMKITYVEESTSETK